MAGSSPIKMHHPTDTAENHHGRLACQSCQRKKIKCSRTFPCEQCMRSSIQCVPSTRKPRARHAGKRAIDSELRNRISKLESLVDSLSGDVNASVETPASDDVVLMPGRKVSTASVGKYIGSQFWSSLTTEVQALREAMEEDQSEDEEEIHYPIQADVTGGKAAEFELILCPPGIIYMMPGALYEPSQEVSKELCDIFITNVDCFMKIFHEGSLRKIVTDTNATYLGQGFNAPANKAIRVSVWFAATCSLTEERCLKLLGRPRAEVLAHFRKHCGCSLSHADLVNTTDLATLQAALTYLAALRQIDTSRRVWTLVALLVRIAQAVGMDHETVPRSPFETELRRRLWHGLRFIDVWASIDRASEQLIVEGSFSTPLPRNVNDSEFDESSEDIPDHQLGLTDTSLALMTYKGCTCTSRLTDARDDIGGMGTWQQRLELVEQFYREIDRQCLKYCDRSIPFQRVTLYVGDSMYRNMVLRAVRPTTRPSLASSPPVHSAYMLQIAMECLKAGNTMYGDPFVQPYRWMIWVPWHPLAVALAGLCSIRDTDLANKAWPHVQETFERAARYIADAKTGMLWRPIQKLYKKAVAFRDHGTTPASASPAQTSPPAQSMFTPTPTAFSNYSILTPPAARIASFSDSSTVLGPTAVDIPPAANGLDGVEFAVRNPLLTGGMDIDFNFNDPVLDSGLGFGNEMNWMDFERILQDMSQPAVDNAMPDSTWQMPASQTW